MAPADTNAQGSQYSPAPASAFSVSMLVALAFFAGTGNGSVFLVVWAVLFVFISSLTVLAALREQVLTSQARRRFTEMVTAPSGELVPNIAPVVDLQHVLKELMERMGRSAAELRKEQGR